jgi:hypothetical protein
VYKTKRFIIGATLLALVLISGSISLACGTEPAQTPAEQQPVSPAAPQLPEEAEPPPTMSEITTNYTTYTDDAQLFSISYPSDWELGLSSIADFDNTVKHAISEIKSGAPIERPSMLFLAGQPTAEGGYSPDVNIYVEPVFAVNPTEGLATNDQMVEAEIRGLNTYVKDYNEFSRIKTTIDGREATIVDYEGTFAGAEKMHRLLMITFAGKTVWIVTCSSTVEDFATWENNFNTIVRSLRISD